MDTQQNRGEKSAVSAVMIAKHPVRSYLRSRRWVWLADIPYKEDIDRSVGLGSPPPPHELAFDIICRARLEEGFLLVSQRPFCVTFYKEYVVPRRLKMSSRSNRSIRILEAEAAPSRDMVCAVQFIVMIDMARRTVVTELWAEPICNGPMDSTLDENDSTDVKELFTELHGEISDDVELRDRKLFERLHTFDRVYTLGNEFRQGVEVGEVGRGRHRARTRDETHFTPDISSNLSLPDASSMHQPSYDIGSSLL
ncbi:hypothetical protein BC829DRAFT_55246 [Chytridium lagenaria]|nr:hypothetical protein BC829DRAFT_55246 [Chytridium lagenaria]